MKHFVFYFLFSVLLCCNLWGQNPAEGSYDATDSVGVDSIIDTYKSAIAKEPKRLDFRLQMIEHEFMKGASTENFSNEITALRNELKGNPTGWKIGEEDIDPRDFDEYLGDLAGNIVNQLAEKRSIEDAEQFVGSLMRYGVPERVVEGAKVELAMTYSSKHLYEKAIDQLKELIDKYNGFSKAPMLFNVALYYSYLGNKDEAIKYALKAQEAGDTERAPKLIHNLEIPDQVARYYDFVFQLMPRLVSEFDSSDESKKVIMSPEKIIRYFQMNHILIDKDLTDIKVEVYPSESGNIYVWTMPAPVEMTDPKYLGFADTGDSYRYYTLEKTIVLDDNESSDPYILGGSVYEAGDTMPMHFSTRLYTDGSCTPEHFVELIKKAMEDKK